MYLLIDDRIKAALVAADKAQQQLRDSRSAWYRDESERFGVVITEANRPAYEARDRAIADAQKNYDLWSAKVLDYLRSALSDAARRGR